MKKFLFSLSTLLQVRRQKEKIAQKNLLEAHLVLRKVSGVLKKLEGELDNIKNQISRAQNEKQHPAQFIPYYDFMESIKKKITRQKIIVREAGISIDRQRNELIKVMQKRKIIENLSDKKYSEWNATFFKTERAALDEMATMRYSRRQKDH